LNLPMEDVCNVIVYYLFLYHHIDSAAKLTSTYFFSSLRGDKYICIVRPMKLTECKECWRVTWIGWMGLLALGCLVLFLFLFTIHPFLAPTKPVDADILIQDNFLVDYGLKKLSDEFRSKNYSMIICTGGLLEIGSNLVEYKTWAELSAARLKKLGINEKVIVPIIPKPVERDKTFASAQAVKNWLVQNKIQPKGINLISIGPYSRNSWMLYKKAIGEDIPVGIIAYEYGGEQDHKRWWKTSSGVRTVLEATIAYLYTKLVFDPKRVRAEIKTKFG
jgi:hypothetical protein